jgi:endoglucanase
LNDLLARLSILLMHKRRRCGVLLFVLLLVAPFSLTRGQEAHLVGRASRPQTGVAQASDAPQSAAQITERRLAHLRHGVNISDWFSQFPDGKGFTRQQFEEAITAQDLALIRAMGFDHVRLCVNPQPLFRPLQADRIPAEPLAYLDAALTMILDQGLAVELDIQADETFKRKLATDDAFVEQFADFWRALARHYSARDPERVFFEVLNEPELRDAYRWYGIEATLVGVIRESAPDHTIIVSGAHSSVEDDLIFLEPLRDPNLLYTFHFYEPFLFTHQGATWAVNYWHFLKGVPYPSDPEAARQAAALVPDPVHRLAVIRYGMSHWDAARIDAEVSHVVEWSRKWGVPVICNEFGAYRKAADPRDRAAWLHDVRAALEKYGIGWTVWDYSTSGFGVVTKPDGQPVPDDASVRALGRTLPAAKPALN